MWGTLRHPPPGRASSPTGLLHASPLTGPVAAGVALAAVAGYVIAVDPSDGPGLVPCPFRATTGWWCPGCGLTRATHQLVHGHLGEALRHNVLVVPVLLAIVLSWAGWLFTASGRRPIGVAVPHAVWRRGTWITIAVAAGFAVLRNLPGIDGLRG